MFPMIVFDVRTAFLMIGLLYLLLPITTWVVLAGQNSLQVALWCGGGLMIGGGLMLLGLFGGSTHWAANSLTPLMLMVSHTMRIQSLRLDLDIPWRMRWIVLAVITYFVVTIIIDVTLQNHVLRAQFNSAVSAGLLVYLSLLARRIGRDEFSRSAKWIAWVYGLVAVTILFRMFSLIGHTGVINFLTEGSSSKIIALSVLLASVVGHFGYVGLALDRSMRREIKVAADLARDEESRRLGEQIAQLDRQRSLGELSASLAHELKQPLTAILTNAQVAKLGLNTANFDPAQLNEILDKVVHNTKRASEIVERIRSYIRPSDVHIEPVNIYQIATEVAELVADEAKKRKVKLNIEHITQLVMVNGDRIQLSQIILNVFRNAIEAATQSDLREVNVSCRCVDNRAILQICDSGPGLTQEILAQVGAPFFTTKPTGLGLGLSISRSIAARHHGTLTIANASIGGAIVELNLPILLEKKA